jgi:hypothetical protein
MKQHYTCHLFACALITLEREHGSNPSRVTVEDCESWESHDRPELTFTIGFLLHSNSCLRLPDGVENALSGRMTQNAKDQQIRRDKRNKRNKRCNSYKQHKCVHEIKLPQKYTCHDAQHDNREQRSRSPSSACSFFPLLGLDLALSLASPRNRT